MNRGPRRIAIIVAEHSLWHWVLTVEAALLLKSEGAIVQIFDFDKDQFNLPFRHNAEFSDLFLQVDRLCRDNNVKIIKKKPKFSLISPIVHLDENGFFSRQIMNQSVIFPTLVDSLKKWNISIYSLKNLTRIYKELHSAKQVQKQFASLNFNEIDEIFTINGRYTRNRMIRLLGESEDIPVHILEFGANENKLEIYERSAQSLLEFQEKCRSAWNNADATTREEVARNYLNRRLKTGAHSETPWTRNMETGSLPGLNFSKKIAVFYSSSQIEFAGSEDMFPDGDFQDQDAALNEILQILTPDKWQVILRKHPFADSNDQWLDKEDQFSKSVLHKHLHIIPGSSGVDSYELARRADIVFTFGSYIGGEITYAGYAPVLNLCTTTWSTFDPEHHISNPEDLKDILRLPVKKTPPDCMLPWGYYLATGGYDFKYFRYKDSQWVYQPT